MSLSQSDLKLIDSMLPKRIDAAAVSIGKNMEERVRAAKEHLEAGTWEVLDQIRIANSSLKRREPSRRQQACVVFWDAERIESHSDKGDLTSVWDKETKKAVHEWTPPPPQAEVISLPKQSDSPPYTENTPQSSASAA